MKDDTIGNFLRQAEAALNTIAIQHGFTLRLVDAVNGTWYFYPEIVENDNASHTEQHD